MARRSFVRIPFLVCRLALGALLAAPLAAAPAAAFSVGFEDVGLGLAPESYYEGADFAGGFTSEGVFFPNAFSDFGFGTAWEGFAYSNRTDTTTPGFGNQFSAAAGGGAGGSDTYGLGFTSTFILPAAEFVLPAASPVAGMWVTNTTYAALAMLNGDGFSKQFGGASGSDPDFFRLTVTGLDVSAQSTGTVEFYLADYRFANSADDYILFDWAFLDLSGLGPVERLRFALDSSDVGDFGMNTPGYFALDDIVVPEPASALLLAAGCAALAGWRRHLG